MKLDHTCFKECQENNHKPYSKVMFTSETKQYSLKTEKRGCNMIILNEEICEIENCDCGWNILIGGENKEELDRLEAFINSSNQNKEDEQ